MQILKLWVLDTRIMQCDRQLVTTGRERPVTNPNEVMMMKCFDSFH